MMSEGKLRMPYRLLSSSIVHDDTNDENDKNVTAEHYPVLLKSDENIIATRNTTNMRSFHRWGGRNLLKATQRKQSSAVRDNEKKQIKSDMKRLIRRPIYLIKNKVNEIRNEQRSNNMMFKGKRKRFLLAAIGFAIMYSLFFSGNNNNNNHSHTYYYYQSSYIEKRIYSSDGNIGSEIQRSERFDSNIPGFNDRIKMLREQNQPNENEKISIKSPWIIQLYGNY
jgi:hypothetical protein